jgi:hypothetical protein
MFTISAFAWRFFFHFFLLVIKMKNSSNSYSWWREKKDMSNFFDSFRHTTSSSFRACKIVIKIFVKYDFMGECNVSFKTWGTTNNMVQKWNIGEKDRMKFWNAPKPPSFWVFVHVQHLKGVIIVRKPNVRSSLRLGHENGKNELWAGLTGLAWEKILWSREWWWDRRFFECFKRSTFFC